MFGPVSGAHLNPAVTVSMVVAREITPRMAAGYIVVQIVGGIAGCILANAMFDLTAISWSLHARVGASQLLSEAVATFGLIGVVIAVGRTRPSITPLAVAAYIVAAYWFTASTSFANPAVTIARAFSDTFAGIRPIDAPAFILAQAVGAAAGCVLFGWLVQKPVASAP